MMLSCSNLGDGIPRPPNVPAQAKLFLGVGGQQAARGGVGGGGVGQSRHLRMGTHCGENSDKNSNIRLVHNVRAFKVG